MNVQCLLQKIREKRRLCPLTNVYALGSLQRATAFWESEKGLAFAYDDHGVQRIGFFAADRDALCELLKKAPSGTYYIETMSRDGDEDIPALCRITRLKRLVNPDCSHIFEDASLSRYRDDGIGEMASPWDASEINRLLWSVFRTEVGHLLYDDELEACIGQGQITIHRAGKIDAVLMADVKPKKFYINQIINLGEKHVIHAMLQSRLRRYAENGGKYLYAWVEEDNTASMKFHKKYGMEHDGMWNVLWLLER